MPIRVLVVDDSALIRQVISDILNKQTDIIVVETANDGEDALEKIQSLKPDVITLDIAMPKMNGLDCLERIMEQSPTPVIVVSYLTTEGAEYTLKALEMGAVDFVTKPQVIEEDVVSQVVSPVASLDNIALELIQKIKTAAAVHLAKITYQPPPNGLFSKRWIGQKVLKYEILAIGASTGGPKALYYLLTQFPADFPLGVVIAQHMPKGFTGFFAKRLDTYCKLEVVEAKNGDEIRPGRILIAPAGYQTQLRREGEQLVTEISEEPKLILKPSVNVLFDSIAQACGSKALAVLLTGMGVDGGLGMQHLHKLGARTIAQDEASCVVYGMPKAAVELGGADYVESLSEIYGRIVHLLNE